MMLESMWNRMESKSGYENEWNDIRIKIIVHWFHIHISLLSYHQYISFKNHHLSIRIKSINIYFIHSLYLHSIRFIIHRWLLNHSLNVNILIFSNLQWYLFIIDCSTFVKHNIFYCIEHSTIFCHWLNPTQSVRSIWVIEVYLRV